MKLRVTNPRKMLIVRMQAYAYENIRQGDLHTAQHHAERALRRYDSMIANNPTDRAAYWAGYYFDRWIEDCEA